MHCVSWCTNTRPLSHEQKADICLLCLQEFNSN